MMMHQRLSRRRVLRGMLGGGAVTVALPFLDCFLDDNGTALADGTQLPPCFGIWYQALGFTPGRWEPEKVGSGYEMRPDLKVLTPFKDRINVYSGLRCFLDGHTLNPHVSGVQAILHGGIPIGGTASDMGFGIGNKEPTLDQLVADVAGTRTRFRSLEVCCDGQTGSLSRRNATTASASEISPAALYARIFGPDFKDPNAAEFVPDPRVMTEKSVLSAVAEQSRNFTRKLGTADRVRLDDYFTSLRELEKKLEIELQRPAPMAACSVPAQPQETPTGTLMDDAIANHKLFAGLLAHALACGQTRVINVIFSALASGLRRSGSGDTYHTRTHEEATDPALGCQPEVTWFQNECLKAFVSMLTTLDSIREGDRTLLDRIVLFYPTDVGFGRTHSMENIPLLTAGSANGRFKTGIHVAALGDPVTRVGLTIQQAFGISVGVWGSESNQTSKTITEVLA